jgi:hypothetical protein
MTKILPYKNLSLKNIPNERWKDVPEYSGYYQLSNCGRFKSLERWVQRSSIKGDLRLKERIKKLTKIRSLNPYTQKYRPQLTISLSRDGEDKTFAASRYVYYSFVKKFDLTDPKLIITSKDGNNLNLHFKNLQLVKKGEVQLKTYRQQKKRKLFKPISKYDYYGRHIKTFCSVDEAAAKTKGNANYLSQAANGYTTHAYGYLWKYGTANAIRPIKFPYRNIKRIAKYTLTGKLLQQFNSITEAENITGFDDIGMRDCAKRRRKTYKGFIWKYVDE